MRKLAALFVVAACSSDGSHPPNQSDGGITPGADGGMTVGDVTCQTHTRTINYNDGTKLVVETSFAVVDADPRGVWVEYCDYTNKQLSQSGEQLLAAAVPFDPPCPANATCTATGASHPTAAHGCSWSPGGTFLDDKLYIVCGTAYRNYNASAVLTGGNVVSYGAIRVHR